MESRIEGNQKATQHFNLFNEIPNTKVNSVIFLNIETEIGVELYLLCSNNISTNDNTATLV